MGSLYSRTTTLKAPSGEVLTLEVYDGRTKYRVGDLLTWPGRPGTPYEVTAFSEPHPMTRRQFYYWKGYIE